VNDRRGDPAFSAGPLGPISLKKRTALWKSRPGRWQPTSQYRNFLNPMGRLLLIHSMMASDAISKSSMAMSNDLLSPAHVVPSKEIFQLSKHYHGMTVNWIIQCPDSWFGNKRFERGEFDLWRFRRILRSQGTDSCSRNERCTSIVVSLCCSVAMQSVMPVSMI
jgi:hypothetical protein